MTCSTNLVIELTKCFLDSPAPKHTLANHRVTLGVKQKEFYTLTTIANPKETRYYEFGSFAIVALGLARRGIDPFDSNCNKAVSGLTEKQLLPFMQKLP